jgi:nitrous oxidase accessory protein
MFFILLFTCFIFDAPVAGKDIHVGKDHTIQTIRQGLMKAADYDRLIIHHGVYHEDSLIIDKPIEIIGKQGAIIDAQNHEVDIITIVADSVTVKGLQFRNVGTTFLSEPAAIKISKCKYVTIQNNYIQDCFFGIYVGNSRHCRVINNHAEAAFKEQVSAGNAIHAWKNKHIQIHGNRVHGYRDGIYLEFVNHSSITNNNSYDNLRYGLHFMFSNHDIYQNNTFRNNGAGVAVMFSKKIKMINNHFVHNWGGSSYGLLLKEIVGGEISQNHFEQNTIGIVAEGATRIIISDNRFTSNGTALDMKGNSIDNQVVRNNFLVNTFEVVTNTRYNQNQYMNNYWSGYSGYDLNHDGFGDVPYRPVGLFAKITNSIPAAMIMLHSPLVNLMEMGEKVFPGLTPEGLTDEAPKMKPYAYD